MQFNEKVLLDIMYLDGDTVLHIIDEGTKFSAAQFLPSISTDEIWETLVKRRAPLYTGLPNKILTDQGSQLGDRFIHIAKLADVEVGQTGVEANSSLGLGERYHEPLRSTFRKIKLSQPNAGRHLALSCAVKAINDTLGPEGIVPSALVFGEYPQVSTRSEPSPTRSTLQDLLPT